MRRLREREVLVGFQGLGTTVSGFFYGFSKGCVLRF